MAYVDIVGSKNLLTKTVDLSSDYPVRRSTKTANAGTAPDGTNTAFSIIADTNNNTHRLDKNPSGLSVNTQYTFSAHLKAFGLNHASLTITHGDNTLVIGKTCVYNLSTGVVESQGSNCDGSSIESLGNGWYRCSMTLTTGGSIAINAVLIGLMSDATTISFVGNNTDGILIWGPQVEEGPNVSQYLANDTSSAVSNAGSDGIWEFDNAATVNNTYSDSADGANSSIVGGVRSYKTPDGRIQRTYIRTRKKGQINLQVYSQDFDNSAWTKNGLTVSANSTTAPDGTTTAETITTNTGTGSHSIYDSLGSTVGEYAYSVYLKANASNFGFVGQYDGSNYHGIVVDLSSGLITATSGTPSSKNVTSVGNGWYRLECVKTFNVNPSYILISLSNSGTPSFTSGRPNFTGVNESIFIWGAQVNEGANVTPYIKTGASASTTIERGEVSKTYFDLQG